MVGHAAGPETGAVPRLASPGPASGDVRGATRLKGATRRTRLHQLAALERLAQAQGCAEIISPHGRNPATLPREGALFFPPPCSMPMSHWLPDSCRIYSCIRENDRAVHLER